MLRSTTVSDCSFTFLLVAEMGLVYSRPGSTVRGIVMSRNDSKQPHKAVIAAAYRGDVKTAIAQLGGGADVNARNAFGNTAATLAARNGHTKVESMLREADNISFVDSVQPKLR